MTSPIILRFPSAYSSPVTNTTSPTNTSSSSSSHSPTPLTPTSLSGKWYITLSTSPQWRDKRNVSVTYTPRPPSSSSSAQPNNTVDDIVSYQSLTSSKISTVCGADTIDASPLSSGPSSSSNNTHNPYLWSWRGAGLIKFVGTKWEVLGCGGGGGGGSDEPQDEDQDQGQENDHQIQWIVSHAQKSMFTLEHVNVFTRAKEGLGGEKGKDEGLRRVKEAFEVLGREMGKEEEMGRLIGELYVVRHD